MCMVHARSMGYLKVISFKIKTLVRIKYNVINIDVYLTTEAKT